MPTRVNSSATYDALIHLIDTINSEDDPVSRLSLFRYIEEQFHTRIVRERDKAAYESRQRYSALDIAETIGADRSQVYEWATRHQKRVNAPSLGVRRRQDLSEIIDLSDVTDLRMRRHPKWIPREVLPESE